MSQAKATPLIQSIKPNKSHCSTSHGKLATAYSTFSEIKWLIYALAACGLLPFYRIISDIEIAQKKCCYASLYTTLVRVFWLLVIAVNSYILFSLNSVSAYSFFGSVNSMNIALHIFLNILCFTVILLSCAIKSQHFLRASNKLLLIDEQLQWNANNTDNPADDCAFQWKYLIYLCMFMVLTLEHIDFQKMHSTRHLLLFLFYCIETSICNCFTIFIALLCHLLALRFRQLNQYAKSYANREQQKKRKQQLLRKHQPLLQRKHHMLNPIFYITLPEECERVTHDDQQQTFLSASSFIYCTHYDLLKIYKELNEYVGLSLLVYYIYVFYVASVTMHRILSLARRNNLEKFPLYCFASLFLHINVVALVTRCCSELKEEAQKIARTLASIYGRNEKSRKVIDKFLTTNLKADLQFTACKVFSIDNSTLFKLCCAVATYLAILRQFRQLETARSEH